MGPIHTAESAVKSEATAVETGFDSLATRLKTVGKKVEEAVAHPFCPNGLREAMPMLMGVLEDMRQELAEQRKPCPCEGQAQTVAAPIATPAPPPAPEASQTAQQQQQQTGTGEA